MSTHRILVPLGFGLMMSGIIGFMAWQAEHSAPKTFVLVEPYSCAVFKGGFNDDGFVGFLQDPPVATCNPGGGDGKQVTCVLTGPAGGYKFVGTFFPKDDHLVIATMELGDTSIEFKMLCDQKGRCNFGILWNNKIDAGIACLRDADWQALNPESKEL